MTKKPVPIGIDSFEKIINEGYYYVDKTLLIKELLDSKAAVTLFTRPRRFGKTLNLSMLKSYFEAPEIGGITPPGFIDSDKKYGKELFEGLKIMKEDKKYLEYMNKYPVIFLTLKSAKQDTFEAAFDSMKKQIASEFDRHKAALNSSNLSDKEKALFRKIALCGGEYNDYKDALKFLSDCLYKVYRHEVIILIDEYDVPIENSFFRGFYTKMIDFIRSLFESAVKTNVSLAFSVITGCLRISKESIFTGLNNLEMISILNEYYTEHFGFTNEEVEEIAKYYCFEEKLTEIKSWYKGYIFGKTEIYNPWSLINHTKALYKNIEAYPNPYWSNTSSNSVVKSLVEKADNITKSEIERLIVGETIEKQVHEEITYEDIYENMDNLWNFLFFTGYLKKVSDRMEGDKRYVTLKIPNEEIKYIYENSIVNWFRENIKTKDLTKLHTALLEGNVQVFQKELTMLLQESISFYDSAENFYHGFVVGVLMHMEGYLVKSNREGGSGRSDIYIQDRGAGEEKAIIIEIKQTKVVKELEIKAEKALEQIEINNYDNDFIEDGYEEIMHVGIAFFKKRCVVKCKKVNV